MPDPIAVVRLGTRASALARWQTAYVARLLRAARPGLQTEVRVISTRGDRVLDTPLPLVGGKGLFTAELEAALRDGTIDLAVHSLKDLPTETPAGLAVGAVPRRGDPRDALVSRGGYALPTLPAGATVGTSSRRRGAQLLYRRPDLRLADVRGNVDTRLGKALDAGGSYDAIVLASARHWTPAGSHCWRRSTTVPAGRPSPPSGPSWPASGAGAPCPLRPTPDSSSATSGSGAG